MKMAKPSERDIDAAGDLMSLLHQLDRGDYPNVVEDADVPDWFDEDDFDHLRAFYDVIKATLDKGPGYPGRVIGGMCYVIMWDKNEIVDPASDVIELHPRLVKALELAEKAEQTPSAACGGDTIPEAIPESSERAPTGPNAEPTYDHLVIALGKGAIEVGQGHDGSERLPAILFGRNGAGTVGVETEGDRMMLPGECIAAITFENAASLDVVAEKLAELRARIWPAPAKAAEGSIDGDMKFRELVFAWDRTGPGKEAGTAFNAITAYIDTLLAARKAGPAKLTDGQILNDAGMFLPTCENGSWKLPTTSSIVRFARHIESLTAQPGEKA